MGGNAGRSRHETGDLNRTCSRSERTETDAQGSSDRIQAELNRGTYPTGMQVSDATLAAVRLERDAFHGDWNYTIAPQSQSE
jgi:hypothetical protein